LPDDIVAPVARAGDDTAATGSRFNLEPTERGRPPDWDASNDYNVLFRGRPVGRIWRAIYKDSEWRYYPWHWDIRPPDESDID